MTMPLQQFTATSPDAVRTIIGCGGWFDQKYRNFCDGRFSTFKIALNLLLQNQGQVIVETGCVRQENDSGAGYSTVLFSDFLSSYGGRLFSVDISDANIALARQLTNGFAARPILTVDDSIHFLSSTLRQHLEFPGKIDLLYLDSFDYPLDRLVAACPNDELRSSSEDELAERFSDLILPPQLHSLEELNAAFDLLHEKSIVLIDDNDLPGGGKSRLAKKALFDRGWTCLLDLQQTVWIPCH